MILKPKKKSPVIAFLLGLLPLLSIGSLLLIGSFSREQSVPLIILIPILLGLGGWGWAYVYLGHPFRAGAAFFAGAAGTLALFLVVLANFTFDPPDYQALNRVINRFVTTVLSIGALAGLAIVVDVAILAARHNREAIQSNSRGQ